MTIISIMVISVPPTGSICSLDGKRKNKFSVPRSLEVQSFKMVKMVTLKECTVVERQIPHIYRNRSFCEASMKICIAIDLPIGC